MPKLIVTLTEFERMARTETVEPLPGRSLIEEACFQIIRHSAFRGSRDLAVGTKVTLEVIE